MSTIIAKEAGAGGGPPVDGEALFEVVDGVRVELPPMSILAARLASKLQTRLEVHAEAHRLGIAVTEGLFIIDPVRDLRRRPDVAFVSSRQWPIDRPLPVAGDWRMVPDLAIEVISPNDLFGDTMAKVEEYFHYGVKQVWIVLPSQRQVQIYDSPTRSRILREKDELDGGELLPGFRLALSSLFQAAAPAAAPQAM